MQPEEDSYLKRSTGNELFRNGRYTEAARFFALAAKAAAAGTGDAAEENLVLALSNLAASALKDGRASFALQVRGLPRQLSSYCLMAFRT